MAHVGDGFVTKKSSKRKLTLHDCVMLRGLCDRRIAQLRKASTDCAESFYAGTYTSMADEVEELFEKITGYPLNVEES